MKWWTVAVLIVLAGLTILGLMREQSPQESAAAAAAIDSTRVCTVVLRPTPLTESVRETSGLARTADGVLWTHNDRGGRPELFGFDATGRPVAHVTVAGAEHVDWEDIEAGPCRSSGTCLHIGDIGDNDATRAYVTVYVAPVPAAGATEVDATPLHVRFPEGPQDAEALFTTADGVIHIITKGEHGPVRLYRVPAEASGEGITVLELVRELAPRPGTRGDLVTAASARRDGRWIAFRTYDDLHFHESTRLLNGSGPAVPDVTFDLRSLNETQGEGLAIDADGAVWLSSEAESGGLPVLTSLACRLGS